MSQPAHIVVIEDDEANRTSLQRLLRRDGYEVEAFAAAEPALAHLRQHPEVAVVITDFMLPGIDGFGVIEATRAIYPDIGILLVTGHGSEEIAFDASKRGADLYLSKPVTPDDLRLKVKTLVKNAELKNENVELKQRQNEKFGKLIGRSKSMETLFRQMDLVAPTRANVLIVGESGTGKELVANALHDNSPRRDKRFLPINCAAIPAEILESELFGHERGSFTGATGRKVGKFELAEGGTLFLDEIGELPLEMQVKLLRVLEQREFMRVGGTETIRVDIRLVAATNADLESAVEENRFRSDLYYRLKVVTLKIPPLRERREDIPVLANHFLRIFAKENGREGMRFSPEVMGRLIQTPWTGNVRELKNVVESLVVLVPQDEIREENLPDEYRQIDERSEGVALPATSHAAFGGELTMDEIEKRAILNALEKTGGNRTQAAEILGIGLRTLQRKLKEYRVADKE